MEKEKSIPLIERWASEENPVKVYDDSDIDDVEEDEEEFDEDEIWAEIRAGAKKEEPAKKSAEEFEIMKSDDDQRLVFGWASITEDEDGKPLIDMQKDMIDEDDLEQAAYAYVLNFRDTGEEHLEGFRKKGKLVESCVFTNEKQKAMGLKPGTLPVGWWVGFYIEDEDAWRKIKNGTYRMFSIEGKAQRVPVEDQVGKSAPDIDIIDDEP